MRFQFNTGGGHEEWTAAVKQQLEQNLGVVVDYSGVPFRDLLNNQQQPTATGLFRVGVGRRLPDRGEHAHPAAGDRLDRGGDTERRRDGRQPRPLQQPGFRRADGPGRRHAGRRAPRNDLYKQAEKIAIGDDLGLIPLFTRQQFRLANTATFGNLDMDFSDNPTLAQITLR